MAQAFRGNRRNQAINDSLSSAFDLGIQPGQKRNNAIVLTTPNRKNITLVTKDGKATDAGKYWYENLHNVPAPTLYRYEQPLIRDTHVKRFDGKEIAVRKWSKTDGDWIITAAGRDYFKYNRSEFVVDVPYVRGELIQGIYDEDVYDIKKTDFATRQRPVVQTFSRL